MNDFKSSVFTVKCTHKRSEKEVVQCWSNTKGNTVSGYRFISLVQTFVPFWKLLHKLLLFLTAKEYTVAVWATQNTAFISTCNTTVLTAFISTCNTDCLQHTLTPCPIPPPPQLQLWNCVTIRSLYPAQTAVSQQCHCHCHHNQITVHKQPLSLPSQSDHCTQLRQLCPNNATVTVITIRSLYTAQTAVSQQCHCHCHHNQITVHSSDSCVPTMPLTPSLPSQWIYMAKPNRTCPTKRLLLKGTQKRSKENENLPFTHKTIHNHTHLKIIKYEATPVRQKQEQEFFLSLKQNKQMRNIVSKKCLTSILLVSWLYP